MGAVNFTMWFMGIGITLLFERREIGGIFKEWKEWRNYTATKDFWD